VVPITLVILAVLFSVQRMGTGWIGGIFGPFMLLWFVVLGMLGIRGILAAPEVLAAINPYYAAAYVLNADLEHFQLNPDRILRQRSSWHIPGA
jgi:KUP system potassium uptake protein